MTLHPVDLRHHFVGDGKTHVFCLCAEPVVQFRAGDQPQSRIIADLFGSFDFVAETIRTEPNDLLIPHFQRQRGG